MIQIGQRRLCHEGIWTACLCLALVGQFFWEGIDMSACIRSWFYEELYLGKVVVSQVYRRPVSRPAPSSCYIADQILLLERSPVY